MRYLLPGTVVDAALGRIRWLYDEFPGVAVCVSGGKDSTVVLELTLQVARERGALPLRVMWLDQEMELQSTVDLMRGLRERPELQVDWYQIPFRLTNSTNHQVPYLNVWGEGEQWMRPKEVGTIHENRLGVDRFAKVLGRIGDLDYPGMVMLTGMRIEESPSRRKGLTSFATYKWATWGRKFPGHTVMHPIYDWSFGDVWRFIHDRQLSYNPVYDAQFRYGIHSRLMRVSAITHETAVHALFWLQEIEPETWARAVERLGGINTAGQMGAKDFFVNELPFMFDSWREYRDYLLETLIDPGSRDLFRRAFDRQEVNPVIAHVPRDELHAVEVQTLIANDVDLTKLDNFVTGKKVHRWKMAADAAAAAG